jgi:hypothetical protein
MIRFWFLPAAQLAAGHRMGRVVVVVVVVLFQHKLYFQNPLRY